MCFIFPIRFGSRSQVGQLLSYWGSAPTPFPHSVLWCWTGTLQTIHLLRWLLPLDSAIRGSRRRGWKGVNEEGLAPLFCLIFLKRPWMAHHLISRRCTQSPEPTSWCPSEAPPATVQPPLLGHGQASSIRPTSSSLSGHWVVAPSQTLEPRGGVTPLASRFFSVFPHPEGALLPAVSNSIFSVFHLKGCFSPPTPGSPIASNKYPVEMSRRFQCSWLDPNHYPMTGDLCFHLSQSPSSVPNSVVSGLGCEKCLGLDMWWTHWNIKIWTPPRSLPPPFLVLHQLKQH